MKIKKNLHFSYFALLILSMVVGPGCRANPDADVFVKTAPTEVPEKWETPYPEPAKPAEREARLWISPAVKEMGTGEISLSEGITTVQDEKNSDVQLVILKTGEDENHLFGRWVYVLAAPFMTVTDNISRFELRRAWRGEAIGEMKARRLMVSETTFEVFSEFWGEADEDAVTIVDEAEMPAFAAENGNAWAIFPFGKLDARWKVIAVDGTTPLNRMMAVEKYELAVPIGMTGDAKDIESVITAGLVLARGNWNPEHITTLVMTGTTALVRTTALRMEEKGIDYPAGDILDWLWEADLLHISNEVPFYSDCPPAKPLREEARFCSDPRYAGLLETIGADIIELTGNHLLDWGPEAMLETMLVYDELGVITYGGGRNAAEALEAVEVEDHGNHLVFIGCNAVGPERALATETNPGAAACDIDRISAQVAAYRDEGAVPIVTFQHFELDNLMPQSSHRIDSKKVSSAGAAIVSGSQAHQAQCMILNGERFIHYGLGNLFFDQMMKANRPAFIDRHVIYEGRHISTELLTTMLEDGARPRPMTKAERAVFLKKVFEGCGQDAAYSQSY